MRRLFGLAAFFVISVFTLLPHSPVLAVEGRTVVLNGLDKVTGRITQFEVVIDRVATFGTFEIRPRFCDKRPPVELPETSVFLEIFDTRSGQREQIFSGWMFASSPGLSAVSHPVYDVWVEDCVDLVAE